jgi:deoxyribodipyrimidine photo-lyase
VRWASCGSRRRTPALAGVFVLDPAILGASDMAPARVWFLLESLAELQQRWRQAGSRLLVLQGDPAVAVAAAGRGATARRWWPGTAMWSPTAAPRDRQVAAQLQAAGPQGAGRIGTSCWCAPEALQTGAGDPYRVYGPFWRNWRGQVEQRTTAGSAAAGGLGRAAPGSDRSDTRSSG